MRDMQTEMSEKEDILGDALVRNGVACESDAGEDTMVFKFRENGKHVGIVRRSRTDPDRFQTEGNPRLFGYDDVAGQEEIVLAGSETDKLSLEAAGISASASLVRSQSGQFKMGRLKPLATASRVVLAFPEGSLHVTHYLAEKLGRHRCFRVDWPESCSTAYEVLDKYGKDRLLKVIKSARPAIPETIGWFSDQLKDRIDDRIFRRIPVEEIEGVSTGWPEIDKYYRPVRGDVTIVTGVPGSGKSEWLLSLALNMAEQSGWRFLYFNFEAKSRDMLVKLLEKRLQCPYDRISVEACIEQAEWLEKHFAFSRNDFDSPSVDEVLEQAKMEAMCPEGLQGLIIDPYNYIERCGKFKADMETEFVKSMLSAVKRFAHEYKVHVWFVSHPAKSASPAERPSMYTIAGSANWFNKTDNGIVIHRTYTPIGFNDEPIQTNQTEFVVEKIRNKEAGRLGQVKMSFDRKKSRYHILSDDDVADYQ